MQDQASTHELKDRLALIESMMIEGRRSTESWGWVFVLWGVAYYVAILWAAIGHTGVAWPVTMISACVVTGVVVSVRGGNHPHTTMSRAIGSIWVAAGISMFLLFLSLGVSGRMDQHILMAMIGAMLGTANAASSGILKWKIQFACAIVWWAVVLFACFGRGTPLTIAFLAAIFLCQIVFGIYAMVMESRRKQREAAHA